MGGSIETWEPLGSVARRALSEARAALHASAQLAAAPGNAWATPDEGHGHLALVWDAESRWMVGAPIGALRLSAALEPERGSLLIVRGREELARLPLSGRTLHEGLVWLEAELRERVADAPERPLAPPDHELPSRTPGSSDPLAFDAPACAELARWYGNTARLLEHVAARAEHATPARLWPHHFDLARLLPLEPAEKGEDARSVGVGMTPGDADYDEPYLYVTPWPRPAGSALPELAGGGAWHTEGWTGAVLTASALEDAAARQGAQARAFVDDAVGVCRRLLEA